MDSRERNHKQSGRHQGKKTDRWSAPASSRRGPSLSFSKSSYSHNLLSSIAFPGIAPTFRIFIPMRFMNCLTCVGLRRIPVKRSISFCAWATVCGGWSLNRLLSVRMWASDSLRLPSWRIPSAFLSHRLDTISDIRPALARKYRMIP